MRDQSSATRDTKSAGPFPLRLRVGVLLILLWNVPFWALAPLIADSLIGLSNPPSVAAVTTAIVVVLTILGLLGFWVAGTANRWATAAASAIPFTGSPCSASTSAEDV